MSSEAGNLVSKSLCLDDGNIINDSLIYMEVVGQPIQSKHSSCRVLSSDMTEQVSLVNPKPTHPSLLCNLLSVVLFDECSGSSLNGLGPHSSLNTESSSVSKGFQSALR